jgi:ABC-type phosphate transport system permease subunit
MVFIPVMPLSIIAAIEGYKVFTKKQTTEKAIKNGSARFGRSLFSTAIGSLVFALGGGVLSLPAAFTAGLYYRRLNNMRKVSDTMKENILKVRSILEFQKLKRGDRNGIL